jgi:hypothetical protein
VVLALVFAKSGILRDQLRPQLGAGGAGQLIRQNPECLSTHLNGDSWVGLEVVVPVWVGDPPLEATITKRPPL